MRQDAIPPHAAGKSLSDVIGSQLTILIRRNRFAFLSDGFDGERRRNARVGGSANGPGSLPVGRADDQKGCQFIRESNFCRLFTSNGPSVVLTITITDEMPHKIKSVELEMAGDGEEEANTYTHLDTKAKAK